MTEQGHLEPGEPHPMAHSALRWINDNMSHKERCYYMEALASCAIEGNEIGEICGETLRRLMSGEPVSDRYILGLAWFLRDSKEREQDD